MEVIDIVPPILKNNVIVVKVDQLFKWAHANSIWPLSSGLACCAIEMMSCAAARFDLSRFGYEVFRPCPRQADLLIVAGTLTWKMTPPLIRLYEEMQDVIPAGYKQHQDLALALALAEKLLDGSGACRVHGGGFAGTIQAFVPFEKLDDFRTGIEAVLGEGSCHVLSIRAEGGILLEEV